MTTSHTRRQPGATCACKEDTQRRTGVVMASKVLLAVVAVCQMLIRSAAHTWTAPQMIPEAGMSCWQKTRVGLLEATHRTYHQLLPPVLHKHGGHHDQPAHVHMHGPAGPVPILSPRRQWLPGQAHAGLHAIGSNATKARGSRAP